MAGAAVTSALFELLFEKLTSGAIEQFGGRLLGVPRELEKLKSTLSAIEAVIQDAEERAVTEKAVRDWVAKLRDAAYDADDLLDEFHTEFERRKLSRSNPLAFRIKNAFRIKKVRIFFSRSNPLAFRINLSSKIKAISDKLDMIAQERIRYNFRDLPPQIGTIQDRMTSAVIDETTVYGRDDDVEKIVNLLLETEEDLSVVTIVGMGGLGKTTLAQLAYNHERVKKTESFDPRIWVCVSDNFDITRIGKAVIEYVNKQKPNLSEKASVVDGVREILEGKKFLLVLDDVWSENEIELEELRGMLVGGAKGSKTIVTTRSDKVASIMGTIDPPYHLGRLAEDDCWKLFEHRAFRNTERDLSLEKIGREIVAKCGGSPLAAKALGSLMRFKRGREEWLAVRDSNTWISTDQGGWVMASLRLSYNHLPPRLKQCFAYCSIFPKDSRIDRDELILQWIALGFIPSDASLHAVDVGNEYFNNLVMMSFLEKESESNYYKMHDLVHDLTQSVAGDEYFIRYADQKEPAPQRYRFCSLVGTLEASELEDFFQESRKIRALRLVDSKITNSIMFSRLQHLRVLDIGDYSVIKELHGSIHRLKHLRYLRVVYNDNISRLPNSIDGLQNLQALNLSHSNRLGSLPQSFTSLRRLVTLDLSHCSNLGSLPETLCSLQSLQSLNLEGCTRLVSLPGSIGKLANLRTLGLSRCSSLVSLPESIGELSNLTTLQLSECTILASLPESLGSLQSLQSLNLKRCSRLVLLPESIGKLANLRTLQLSECRSSLVSLPESIGKLANLRTLGLSECTRLVSLPQSLSNLSNLQELDLGGCINIAELPEGMANMTSLRHLKNGLMWSLNGMPSGMGQLRSLVTLEWFVVGEGSNHSSIAEMEHLNLIAGKLKLTHLENVKSPIDAAMTNLKEKKNLRQLSLSWSGSRSDYHHHSFQEEAVFAELMPHPNMETLEIHGYPGIKLPNWLIRTMGDSVSGLPNLVELALYSLKCLPSLVGGLPPCLKKLTVSDANAMTNISTFPLLQLVELWLGRMSNLEEWSASVLLYPRLVKLTIKECPKMHAEPCIPASVEHVKLIGDCDVGKLFLGRRVVGGLPSPSSPPPPLRLRKLEISRGSPDLLNGLHYIRSAATLEELIIQSSDMVDLPEAIRCFTSSLRELRIGGCPNLARLPEWLPELTSLKKLWISGCSRRLKERCAKDTGEDWPKIAHIPNLHIW